MAIYGDVRSVVTSYALDTNLFCVATVNIYLRKLAGPSPSVCLAINTPASSIRIVTGECIATRISQLVSDPVHYLPQDDTVQMSRHFLAPELITGIFELIMSEPDPHTMSANVRTLRSCTLVCKDWTPAAQRILFHRVTTRLNVFSQKSILNLDLFLTHQLNIGTRILSLDLVAPVSPPEQKSHPAAPILSVKSLEQILSHCPHLYHLNLHIDIDGFEEDEIARLSALPVKIRSLDVAFECAKTKTLPQLFFIWPTIRHLSYRNLSGTKMIDPLEVLSERPQFTLYELSLHAQLDHHVLDWLVPPPNKNETAAEFQPSLRILEICADMLSEHSQWNYAPFAPFIRSLRISGVPEDAMRAQILEPFQNLEELVLRDCFVRSYTFLHLSPTLKHYRYHRSSHEELKKIRALWHGQTVLQRCPELEVFTMNLNHSGNGSNQDLYELVKEGCAKRDVRFNVDPRIWFMVGSS